MASQTDIWRAGLQARGRDWVLAELNTRPGQPEDTLLDVVHEPPHPTREFCQRWCVEDDNRLVRVSTSTKAALCVLVLLIAFTTMGVHSCSSMTPHGQTSHATQ